MRRQIITVGNTSTLFLE